MRGIQRIMVRAVAVAGAALAVAVPAASADTITVTSTADSGPGTIRAALAAANDGDTIVVPPGTYAVTSADLDVDKGVILHGTNARTTILRSDGDNRVLEATSSNQVTVEGVTITNGKASPGGGIRSTSPLILTEVAINGNGTGGGDGGGLWTSGQVTIDRTLIAHNAATNGGGIEFASGSDGSSIETTTIASNSATADGGGFHVAASPLGFFTVLHATIAGNAALRGQAYFTGANGHVHTDRTVFTDSCWEDPGAVNDSGGGNVSSQQLDDCNLIGPTDLYGADTDLAPLGDYGGPTDTMLLRPNSQAIDHAQANMFCPGVDQRGVRRPQGTMCDTGAFELTVPKITVAAPHGVTATSATFGGTVDTRGLPGTATLEYGETNTYGASKSTTLEAVNEERSVSFKLTGLQPSTLYHYRGVITTPDGTIRSSDETFKTPAAPPPPPKPQKCRVPNLKGLTLSTTKRALKRAHCRLGKVRYRHTGHATRRPVVVRQSPKPFVVRAAGTKVNVTLTRRKR
jgi:hypothetical protein